MQDDDENELFEIIKRDVADTISLMIEAHAHPALTFAALMSVIFYAIMTEGFWHDDPPGFDETRGCGNLTQLRGFNPGFWIPRAKLEVLGTSRPRNWL